MKGNLYKNKKVTVMGIGLHGGSVSMIQWLSGQGAKVTATDKKPKEELTKSIEKIKDLKNIKIITGQHRMEDFTNADLVIKNPIVSWENKYIKAATENKIPVEMDASLFFKYCKSKKIIGVTGTKGKTTVALLVLNMLRNEGNDVVGVGIGQEPVMAKLEKITPETWVVFELSSWRCSALGKMKTSPAISVVTNIFPDHLNYYNSMEDYIDDKLNIIRYQTENDYAIFNADDETTPQLIQTSEAKDLLFSLSSLEDREGAYIKEGSITLALEGEEIPIIPVSEIGLRGPHNIYNACAMCAVGAAIEMPAEIMSKTLRDFKNVHHRLELIDEVKGIKFFNDSAATTPEAALAGINSFTEKIHLICGGSSKKLSLDNFAKKIAGNKNILKIYLLKGEATENLEAKIKNNGASSKIVKTYDNIKDAVLMAYQNAQKSEVVLLSPGCASFGMFANEYDRGNKFIEIVEKIRKKSK